jgi:hypothetical protein
MVIFPIVVSSRARFQASVDTVVAGVGERAGAAPVAVFVKEVVYASVLTVSFAGWVQPAASTSASTHIPARNNSRNDVIVKLVGHTRK